MSKGIINTFIFVLIVSISLLSMKYYIYGIMDTVSVSYTLVDGEETEENKSEKETNENKKESKESSEDSFFQHKSSIYFFDTLISLNSGFVKAHGNLCFSSLTPPPEC